MEALVKNNKWTDSFHHYAKSLWSILFNGCHWRDLSMTKQFSPGKIRKSYQAATIGNMVLRKDANYGIDRIRTTGTISLLRSLRRYQLSKFAVWPWLFASNRYFRKGALLKEFAGWFATKKPLLLICNSKKLIVASMAYSNVRELKFRVTSPSPR